MEDVTRVNKSDRKLGMRRPITRRDFLNGVSVGIGGAMLAQSAPVWWSINAWQRRPNLRNPMVKEFKRKAEIAAVNRRGTDYRAIDGVRTSHARAAGLACNYNSAT